MTTSGIDEDLLTAEEVARWVRLKTTTVYEAASDGRLPCVRLWKGKRKSVVRFRRGDIERFIAEHATEIGAAEVK